MNDRHAYLIMAHGNYDQLHMLLRALDHPLNDVFIHVDAKAPQPDISALLDGIGHATVQVYRRYRIYWGHYSQTACEMFLLEKAISSGQHAYYHLLSGVDLPLKTQDEIHEFFGQHPTREFVSLQAPQIAPHVRRWVSLYYPMQRLLRASRSPVIYKLLEYISNGLCLIQMLCRIDRLRGTHQLLQKGATWFSITDAFARYVVDHADWVEETFRHTRSSDEIFLQTLLANSPFAANRWPLGYEEDGETGIRLIDWERGNPYVFRSGDFGELMKSTALFARKFDDTRDPIIIERIVEALTDHQ